MIYHIYYFSATGNTQHTVERISEGLVSKGHSVTVVRINATTPPLDRNPDVLVLAFPVLSWSPPALVLRFIRRLPSGGSASGRMKAAMISCDGGGGLQAPLQAKRMLARRGYEVFLAGSISYPENWRQVGMVSRGEDRDSMIRRGDAALQPMVENLSSLKKSFVSVKPLAFAFSRLIGLLFGLFGRRFLGKIHIADNACNSCRLCVNTCPVNAISMGRKKNAKPFWKINCESCNRCLNICPKNAINASFGRIAFIVVFIGVFIYFGLQAHALLLGNMVFLNIPIVDSLIDFLTAMVIIVASHWIVTVPMDGIILRPLQHSRLLKGLFYKSFTSGSAQYLMPGYRPPMENIKK